MKLLFVNACVREHSRTLLLARQLHGIREARCIRAENLDMDGADVAGILEETIKK